MKKILCIVLSFCLMFSFAACGKKEDEQEKGTLDIEYYTRSGKMPECKYLLGADPSIVISELSTEAENAEDHDYVYDVSEDDENVCINNGTFSYYYKKDKIEEGISCIVNTDAAYGFEHGAVILEVKEAIKGYKYKEEETTQENTFFMFGTPEGTVLRCDAGENSVIFVFVDNALCATAVFDKNVW